MNSLIPLIPQDVLLELGGPTIALSILSIVFKLPDKIEKLKKRLSNSIGIDKDSGIPLLAPKAVRNLLNFRYERYLAALVVTVAIALVFGVVYIVSFSFDQSQAPVWVATIIAVCGWIALLSVVLACFILLDMGIYVLKLGIKAYRK